MPSTAPDEYEIARSGLSPPGRSSTGTGYDQENSPDPIPTSQSDDIESLDAAKEPPSPGTPEPSARTTPLLKTGPGPPSLGPCRGLDSGAAAPSPFCSWPACPVPSGELPPAESNFGSNETFN